MRLTCAILFAKDIHRLTAFYERLGLEAIEATRATNWVEFAAGSTTFALHAIPDEIAAGIEIADPPVLREETPIKLVFSVDDVDAECARLAAAGIQLTRRPWGVAEGADPEGNIFQVSRAANG